MSCGYYIKYRKYLAVPILAIMLLAGMYMDRITIRAYENAGSFSPSRYCRSQYSVHRDIVPGIFDGGNVLRKMEARRNTFSGRPDRRTGFSGLPWTMSYMPVFSVVEKRIAYECNVLPLATIIRYIHNQDGEKNSFLQM